MLEIGSFFGKCSFRGFSGTNGDSLIFPKLWGQGNRYLNGENWGIFEVGTVQYFGEYRGQIPQKTSNFGVGTGTAFLGNLASLLERSAFKKCSSTFGLQVKTALHTINIMLTMIYVSFWPT